MPLERGWPGAHSECRRSAANERRTHPIHSVVVASPSSIRVRRSAAGEPELSVQDLKSSADDGLGRLAEADLPRASHTGNDDGWLEELPRTAEGPRGPESTARSVHCLARLVWRRHPPTAEICRMKITRM